MCYTNSGMSGVPGGYRYPAPNPYSGMPGYRPYGMPAGYPSGMPYGMPPSSAPGYPPIPRPSAPPMPNPAQEKAKIIEELKKVGTFLIRPSTIVNEKHAAYMKEVKQAVANLQKVEAGINRDESELETKKLILQQKQKEVEKLIDDDRKVQVKIQDAVEKSESIDVNDENVLEYVKPSNELHELWLKKEAKRKSIEACVQVLKKSYEDKSITLEALLDSVRRLASKEFMCIYKKAKFEGLSKRQERSK